MALVRWSVLEQLVQSYGLAWAWSHFHLVHESVSDAKCSLAARCWSDARCWLADEYSLAVLWLLVRVCR